MAETISIKLDLNQLESGNRVEVARTLRQLADNIDAPDSWEYAPISVFVDSKRVGRIVYDDDAAQKLRRIREHIGDSEACGLCIDIDEIIQSLERF